MINEVVYFSFSFGVAILAIAAAFIAKFAMARGLTYSAFAATVWTLTFLALARIAHSFREFFNLDAMFGGVPEIAEYALYVIAYAIFIILVCRAFLVKK